MEVPEKLSNFEKKAPDPSTLLVIRVASFHTEAFAERLFEDSVFFCFNSLTVTFLTRPFFHLMQYPQDINISASILIGGSVVVSGSTVVVFGGAMVVVFGARVVGSGSGLSP